MVQAPNLASPARGARTASAREIRDINRDAMHETKNEVQTRYTSKLAKMQSSKNTKMPITTRQQTRDTRSESTRGLATRLLLEPAQKTNDTGSTAKAPVGK